MNEKGSKGLKSCHLFALITSPKEVLAIVRRLVFVRMPPTVLKGRSGGYVMAGQRVLRERSGKNL